jgi:UDP-glucose 4-epimerase
MQAKDSIVARLMRAIRLGGTFEVYGDGTQVRDYVHVSDVFSAVRLGLVNEAWQGPVIIGTGSSLSVLQVLEAVRRVTGAELSVTHGPARPGEVPAVIVDPSHANGLGWTPRYSFEEGLDGVWEEWSSLDLDSVSSGAGALGVAGAAGAAGAAR